MIALAIFWLAALFATLGGFALAWRARARADRLIARPHRRRRAQVIGFPDRRKTRRTR